MSLFVQLNRDKKVANKFLSLEVFILLLGLKYSLYVQEFTFTSIAFSLIHPYRYLIRQKTSYKPFYLFPSPLLRFSFRI